MKSRYATYEQSLNKEGDLGCMGMSAAYGQAADVNLSQEDMDAIEGLLRKYPNIGPRYSARENKFVEKQ